MGVLPSHAERLHTHYVATQLSGSLPAAQVAERLAEAANNPKHEFWPADVNMLADGVFDWSKVLGHRQVTDVYLLSLAVQHGGRFVTFDRRIVLDSVKGARAKNLVVLT